MVFKIFFFAGFQQKSPFNQRTGRCRQQTGKAKHTAILEDANAS
jgi:hypothetical protein